MQYKAFTGIIHKLHSTPLQFITGKVTVNLTVLTSASSVIASNTIQLQFFPTVGKIYYLTDGAASQYKNFKNMINLVYHQDDFGIQAEWNFLQLLMVKVNVMLLEEQ